jgi:hypothetical protein
LSLRLEVRGIFFWRLTLRGELGAGASSNQSPVKISKPNPHNPKKQAGIMWHRKKFFERNFSIGSFFAHLCASFILCVDLARELRTELNCLLVWNWKIPAMIHPLTLDLISL